MMVTRFKADRVLMDRTRAQHYALFYSIVPYHNMCLTYRLGSKLTSSSTACASSSVAHT